MALVLNLKKGEDFFIIDKGNKHRCVVTRIDTPTRFKLTVEKGMNEEYKIDDRHSEVVYPNVRISAGEGRHDVAKVNVEAPSKISIVRGKLMP